MNINELATLLCKISKTIEENKEYLTDLDRPIGDCDHGINMARGFKAVEEKLSSTTFDDIGKLLMTCGMTLVSQVGGSSGPLYGTAFMNVGKSLLGKQNIEGQDFPNILKVAVEGVQFRGNAQVGEATMVDAMMPAYEEAVKSFNAGLSTSEMLKNSAKAAQIGAESTIPMVATKGRASYVGERGIGHKDPGAESFSLILKVISEEVA